jgi:ERCC4-type nuclease
MALPLLIDNRDGSRELMEWLDPTVSELTRLEFGDAMIVGNGPDDSIVTVGVEVKSVSDLLSSANTGRIQGHQLPGLLDNYDIPYLLYYGYYTAGEGGTLLVNSNGKWKPFRIGTRLVPWGYIESFILDLSAVGVRVKHCASAEEAARWLMWLHRWWSKRWTDHKGLRALDRSREPSLMPNLTEEEEFIVRVAMTFPAVGFEKAMAFATSDQAFASVRQLINASPHRLAQVPGIGKVIANAIHRKLGEP